MTRNELAKLFMKDPEAFRFASITGHQMWLLKLIGDKEIDGVWLQKETRKTIHNCSNALSVLVKKGYLKRRSIPTVTGYKFLYRKIV